MRFLRSVAALFLVVAMAAPGHARNTRANVIVLIGGNTPHKPGVHDGRTGVTALARDISASPSFRGMTVRTFPEGWPADPAAFAGAATILFYFDGLEFHPLRDPARRAAFAAQMRRGVGLVALHQAGTVLPEDDTALSMQTWLGAVRPGMTDRSITTDRVVLKPTRHIVARGVKPLTYADEFYPTLRFARAGIVPVATAKVRVEHAPNAPATNRTIAWAYERPAGGRSFGFTGLHHVQTLQHRDIRQLILNGVLWTAGRPISPRGVHLVEAIR